MLRYQEEVVIEYKAFVGFRKGLERSGVESYRFGNLIAIAHLKT